MNSEAFASWASLFSDNLADAFVSQQNEFRKLAMIILALKSEFKRIESNVDRKFDELKYRKTNSQEEKKDAFRENDRLNSMMVKPKQFRRDKTILQNTVSVNLLNTTAQDSQLPCSFNLMNPSLIHAKTVSSAVEEKTNSELTASFSKNKVVSRRKKITGLSDKYSPLVEDGISTEQNESFSKQHKKENKDVSHKKFSLKVKKSPQFVYKTETVRGKAKMELPGWSCRKCKDFYEALELSPETKRVKMNDCSKHRSKYQPPADSPEGFWDLTFPSTPDTQDS